MDKAKLIAQCAAEKKGDNIVLMDMRKAATEYEWFVVVSAGSTRRMNAIVKATERTLSKNKMSFLRVEGKNNPHWILMDCNDVIVHVFHEEIREFYGLERLWSDVPIERFNNKCLEKTSQKKYQRSS
ncbi:MAG: ribosome silencing factor [Candidatus Omnitrophota bacterium]